MTFRSLPSLAELLGWQLEVQALSSASHPSRCANFSALCSAARRSAIRVAALDSERSAELVTVAPQFGQMVSQAGLEPAFSCLEDKCLFPFGHWDKMGAGEESDLLSGL